MSHVHVFICTQTFDKVLSCMHVYSEHLNQDVILLTLTGILPLLLKTATFLRSSSVTDAGTPSFEEQKQYGWYSISFETQQIILTLIL